MALLLLTAKLWQVDSTVRTLQLETQQASLVCEGVLQGSLTEWVILRKNMAAFRAPRPAFRAPDGRTVTLMKKP